MALGGLSARIHSRRTAETDGFAPHLCGYRVPRLLGPHWVKGERTNRELLMEACTAQGLKLMDTWFRNSQDKNVSYMVPGTMEPPGQGINGILACSPNSTCAVYRTRGMAWRRI